MKKNILLAFISIILFAGCSTHIDAIDGADDAHKLSFNISDRGFSSLNGKNSRAADNLDYYTTIFVKDDQIGVYVVSSSGTVEKANLRLTFNGSSWNYDSGVDPLYYDATAGRKYFAYYPYQSTLTGAPAEGATNITATDAPTFFLDAVNSWTPAADQHSHKLYTANDLMVATGAVGALTGGLTYPITFSMLHQMALVELQLPYYVLSTDGTHGYTQGLMCTNFNPLHVSDGTYRYLVKPNASTTTAGYYCNSTTFKSKQAFSSTFTSPQSGGYYYTIAVDNPSNIGTYTLQVGDYLLDDGGIVPNAATNDYLIAALKRSIAVVFSTSTSDTDKNTYFCKSGYAMSLQNASWYAWETVYDGVKDNFDQPTYTTTFEQETGDLDGYSHTRSMIDYGGGNGKKLADFPAYNAALQYGNDGGINSSPSGVPNSGWYLPSIGQLYTLAKNLGGLGEWNSTNGTFTFDDPSLHNFVWSSSGKSTLDNISTYLYKVSSKRTVDINLYQENIYILVWSSSEYQVNYACMTCFTDISNNFGLCVASKDGANLVRPVIAF